MEAEAILERLRSKEPLPEGWLVFPLQHGKVIRALIGWTLCFLLGAVLFTLLALDVIPENYQHGPFRAIVTTIFLGMFLFLALGSIWSFIIDLRRLREAERHVLIITPEDFVKREGKKIIHVPLTSVRHVTARGVRPPERRAEVQGNIVREIPGLGENATAFFIGRKGTSTGMNWFKRRRRTPASLAFVDARTGSNVIVVNDTFYGDPFLIAAHLKQYAAAVQQLA